MTFRIRISERIDELGFNPSRVSQDAGLSPAYLRLLLKPESTQVPSIEAIDALAMVLHTTREWLWDGILPKDIDAGYQSLYVLKKKLSNLNSGQLELIEKLVDELIDKNLAQK